MIPPMYLEIYFIFLGFLLCIPIAAFIILLTVAMIIGMKGCLQQDYKVSKNKGYQPMPGSETYPDNPPEGGTSMRNT